MKKMDTISIFIHDSIFISEEMTIRVITIKIAPSGCLSFSAKEIATLRAVLHNSIGAHADKLTVEELSEFGASMLNATAVVLKTKYLNRKVQLEI